MLACDGIWDVLSNEDVCIFVREQIAQGLYPEEICENLMTKCLAPDCQVRDCFLLCPHSTVAGTKPTRHRIGKTRVMQYCSRSIAHSLITNSNYVLQMGGLGGDNMTVILVCFLHNKPYEELIEKCKTALATNNINSGSRKSSEADTVDDEI